MTNSANPFDDPQHTAAYAERAEQMVPTYRDIHRLATVLMAEHAPRDARILVLGAGGGLETKAFAEAHSGWTFDAVDPALAMLDLAAKTLGPHAARVRMHHGYIEDAPTGPFDAAASLLTLHFLSPEVRLRTVTDVRKRLRPGAPFVLAHLSFPQRDDAQRQLWVERHIAYLSASGIDRADTDRARAAVATQVPVLTPEQDRSILEDAGFTAVTEFFSAFTFRGWVCYA
ncbi:class I SAM-dependent methyltransferase [soil metagenome]